MDANITINKAMMDIALEVEDTTKTYFIMQCEIEFRKEIIEYLTENKLETIDLTKFRVDAKKFFNIYKCLCISLFVF